MLWPTISDVVIEALEEFSTYTLVECCDHIQATCNGLISTNNELRQSLDATMKVLPDPSMTYIDEIEQNIIVVATLKSFISDALKDRYILMQ